MEFEPHPLLRDAHAMTLAGMLPRKWLDPSFAPLARGEPLHVRVDRETEVFVWVHRQPHDSDAPLAVLLHGLSGSAESRYIHGLGARLYARGFHVARMNMRNCGGSEHLSATFYCTAQSGDVFEVARAARERCDAPRVYVCGWSMGGNMVLKLAGELADQRPPWLAAVAAVSPALDLEAAQRSLDEVVSNEVYRRFFLGQMRDLIRRKEARWPGRYSSLGLERIETFRHWDERVTAPYFGFADAPDFYRRGAARSVFERICVPVCVVHAQDDPFVPFAPWHDPDLRPRARFEFHGPAFGGHCAFISSATGRERFWAEQRISDFFWREEAQREENAAVHV